MSKILEFLPGFGILLLEGCLQVSGYQNITLAWGLGIAGIIALAIPLIIPLLRGRAFYPGWKWPIPYPFKALIRLDEAVLKVYEKLREDKSQRIIEILNTDTGDLRFVHIADKLLEGNVLYGTHPPSRKIEVISKDDMGTISFDCKHTAYNDGKVFYDNLMVERKVFSTFIKSIT